MQVMSISCYPFIVNSYDPVNSITIVHIMFSRQRFLLASTFLSSSLIVQLASCLLEQWYASAYFSCAEKSSLVSSSSQLSSHKCVLSPGTSVSSCVQSAITHNQQLPSRQVSPCHEFVHPQRPKHEGNIPSTGKSSNSSSSSNAVAAFVSFVWSAFLSAAVALAAGAAPEAGAADMMMKVI